jgi:MFS family permease
MSSEAVQSYGRDVRLTLVRDRLTWIAYGHLAIFAYYLYGFSPAVPLLRDEQGTSRAVAGLHGSAFALGTILAGTMLPRLVRRVGRYRAMWLGQAGLGAAVLGLWASHPLPATLAWALFAGFSATFLCNSTIALLSDHHGAAGPAAISEANAVAAGVGLVSPLVVGASVAARLGWRPGLAVLVLLSAGLALVATIFPVRPTGQRPSVAHASLAGRLPRAFWLAATSLIATASVEISLTLWAGDLLRTRVGVSAGIAAAAVSAIVGGIFIGRLVGVRLLLRFAAPVVLLGALAISAVGFAVFWLATVAWLALVGLVVCGLGISMHFPVGMALAMRHSDGQPDLAGGRLAYALGVGFGGAPFVLGAMADRIGPHLAFGIVFLMLAVSATAVTRLWMLSRPPQGDERDPQRAEQVAEHRQGQADDVPVVALDPGDERPAPAVEGERARDRQRLAAGHVRLDLVVGDVGEEDRGRGDRRGALVRPGVDQAVAGVQHAAAVAHASPARDRVGGVRGLAENLPVKREDRVATEDECRSVDPCDSLGDGLGLEAREGAA